MTLAITIDVTDPIANNMNTRDLLATSRESLFRNKSRSGLTILGIVIGIAAVILMLSIGQGAESLILNQIADLGSDLVFVEPSSGDPTAGPPDPFIEQTINMDDVDALRESGIFTDVSPVLVNTVAVSHETVSTFSQVQGISGEYINIFPADLAAGRFIDDTDVDAYAKVAVLGKSIAEDLFGDQDPIGMKMKVKNTTVRVVGVLEEQGSRFFQNLDDQIGIPITTTQRDIFGLDYVNYIVARTSEDIESAKEEMRYILRDTHDIDNPEGVQEKDDFFVSSQSDAEEIIGVVGSVLTILLSSIAAISLLVGGIGIMNIMFVSVSERTKEIGLRKSVGATYKEILRQFLTEAVILTMAGGVLGVFFGVSFSFLTSIVMKNYVDGWDFIVPPEAIILAVVVSTVVGIVFGIYPARRAARLDPIEALRYE